ncbi:MAG: AAA family ATPase [Bacteroidales bacterium]|nr:AAA family ATPase [Bacteroidales bacterium]
MKIELSKNALIAIIVVFVGLGAFTVYIDRKGENDSKEFVEEAKREAENQLANQNNSDGTSKKGSGLDKLRQGVEEEEAKKKAEAQKPQEEETDPYEELNELIGLGSVKKEVMELANFVNVQNERRKQGMKTPKMSYHLVFTGNPGTGKTTVARIIARIYKDLGILKKGHLVETDRAGLVGSYVGQTAPKTNHICDSALGGVLFIDEAYSLTPEHGDSYGEEAVSTLLKRMEDDRENLVVIVAGYNKEMKRFIESNPGLQSRFTRYIDFPDYSASELVGIYKMYMKKNTYELTADGEQKLIEKLNYAVAHKDRNFGNARYVRNIFEKSAQFQANRIAQVSSPTTQQLKEITGDDIEKAFASVKTSM